MSYPQRIVSVSAILLVVTIVSLVVGPACSHKPLLRERFQAVLDSLHADYAFPGATAACVLPDGTVEDCAVGLADIENEIPMTPRSRMLAASVGKTFVGAAVLALASDGSLDLDDSLSAWLGHRSWFSRLPNHETVTLRHLLNHTSGIPNHVESERFAQAFGDRWDEPDNPLSPEELIAFVLDQQPLSEAGRKWHYTDTGYLLLGLVIEQISGHRWYDEVMQRFITPLNLSRTAPSDRVDLPGLAAGYMVEDNPFGLPPKTTATPGHMVWNPGIEGSGGGFLSNSRDLAVWGKMLYEGRAMKGNYLDDLLAAVPIADTDSSIRYGVAVAVHTGGPLGPTYGHGGWIPGYTTSLRYYPDLGIAVAFQINSDIEIAGASGTLVENMEQRLAETVAAFAK